MATDVPDNILQVQELPEEVTSEMLEALFKQFPGYIQVRLLVDKRLAYIEFDNDSQAGVALSGLKGFKLSPTQTLNVTYAKK